MQEIDITLYIGGTRSGKSVHAEQHALALAKGAVIYVATAECNNINANNTNANNTNGINNANNTNGINNANNTNGINNANDTNTTHDAEMRARISQHKKRRPPHWKCLEAPLNVAEDIKNYLVKSSICKQDDSKLFDTTNVPTILIDCVTLWVSNILYAYENQPTECVETEILKEVNALIELMKQIPARWILVSGETGLGGIGTSPLERQFHDALGRANQLLSFHASQSFLVIAGQLLQLKKNNPLYG